MENTKDGKTMETAFIITDSSGEMTSSIANLIDRLFGGNDGSYFIFSETTTINRDTKKKYKVLYVEDSTGGKQNVFFEIM